MSLFLLFDVDNDSMKGPPGDNATKMQGIPPRRVLARRGNLRRRAFFDVAPFLNCSVSNEYLLIRGHNDIGEKC